MLHTKHNVIVVGTMKLIGKLKFVVAKVIVDWATIIFILRFRESSSQKPILTVYMLTNKYHFYLTLLSALSLQTHLKQVQFLLIENQKNKLTKVQTKIVMWMNPTMRLISSAEIDKIKQKLKGHKNLINLYNYDWTGEKLLIPLLHQSTQKIMILDSDTLFFQKPQHIIKWLNSKSNTNLYLKDYKNFSTLSSVEVGSILGRKPRLHLVNSGLLCLNKTTILPSTNPTQLSQTLQQMTQMVTDRLSYDNGQSNPLTYVSHMREQTLYWIILEKAPANQLPPEYLVFPQHVFGKQPIRKPKFIHFTGDTFNKRYLYKYLFFSLLHKLKSQSSALPWFIASDNYCPQCKHSRKTNFS